MFDFFKNINEGNLSSDSVTFHEPQVDGSSNELLNCEINESEITDAVKKLKKMVKSLPAMIILLMSTLPLL